jgi:hypothetical protein
VAGLAGLADFLVDFFAFIFVSYLHLVGGFGVSLLVSLFLAISFSLLYACARLKVAFFILFAGKHRLLSPR